MHDTSYEDSEFEFQTQVKRPAQSTLDHGESSIVDYDESPHFPRDKSKYTLSPTGGQQNVSKGGAGGAIVPMQPEPNVDFEFHVKIFIKGGKCVLHTRDMQEEKRKMKKEKSFTGGLPTGGKDIFKI